MFNSVWKNELENLPEKKFVKIKVGLPVETIEDGKTKRSWDETEEKIFSIPVNSSWSKKIVGISFKSDYKITSRDAGKDLQLVREPDNKFDPTAIKVMYKGKQLGYVDQFVTGQYTALKLSRLMDLNYDIKARIKSVNGGAVWLEDSENIEEFEGRLRDRYSEFVDMDEIDIEEVWDLLQKNKFSKLSKILNDESIKNKGVTYELLITETPDTIEEVEEDNKEKPKTTIKDKKNKAEYKSCKGTKSQIQFFD